MWWRKKPEWQAVYQPGKITYPGGTAVRILATDKYWYITKGKKFLVPTKRVLESWNFNSVAFTHADNMEQYKYGGKLGFRDGTLIRDIGDSKVYLIADNKRRHIVDPDTFDRYGLNRAKIVEVSVEEAQLHDDGEVLK